LWTSGVIAAGVSLVLILKWRDILLHAFDPVQAKVSGLRVHVIHYGLLVVLSATIVATLTAVGIILAIALLIAPGAIAFLLTRRFAAMMMVAVAASMLAGAIGIYASFFIDAAPAPTVVLVLTSMFIAAFVRSSLVRRVAVV
jgi:manganese/iron transport system permease protein